jgi:uncharacterized protein (TIGR00255 family)
VQRLREALARGRVELKLSVKSRGAREVRIDVDEAVAARYIEASNRLARRDGVALSLASSDLLRLPQVVSVDSLGAAGTDHDTEVVGRAVDEALEHLIASREKEGLELAGVLQRTVSELKRVVSELDASRAELQHNLHEKTRKRLGELAGDLVVEESRLAQEVALLVDRSDVQEEIDRLNVHVEGFGGLLEVEEAVGKRLDFLAQEILRELNTIGSKCRNSAAIQLVLDGKVFCEQLREQVQNVE